MNSSSIKLSRCIYPKIETTSEKKGDFLDYEIRTVLRVKHTDGKWYLVSFNRARRYGQKDIEIAIIPFAQSVLVDMQEDTFKIVSDVYQQIQLGVVELDLTYGRGNEKVWELDENQQSEKERLVELI